MKENENDFICTCLEGYDGANCENTPCDTGEFCRMGKPSLQEGPKLSWRYISSEQLESSISPQSEKPENTGFYALILNCLDPCDATGTKECVVTGNERLCVCNIGYWGDKCEQSGCNPDPCKNKAACEPVLAISADTNNFVCTCEDETYFMGETCNESRVVNTARNYPWNSVEAHEGSYVGRKSYPVKN